MAHVHLIGIGGSGLSAIARVLLESGNTVSGSDRQPSPLARSLQEAGARVFYGHRAENLAGAEMVVRSSAIPEENVEVQAALAAGLPVLKRSDFLGRLMQGQTGIAVAGTHGKTTTTAMTAWVLAALGQDPSYIIGGVSKNLGANAHAGQGRAFVIEADEYDRMFLGLTPQVAVVTNVEHDHPDCFPSPEDYFQAFLEFTRRLEPQGVLLVCGNDSGAVRIGREAARNGIAVLEYGTSEWEWAYRAWDLRQNDRGGFSFSISVRKDASPVSIEKIPCSLQVPGVHNVRNALAALAVAHRMQLPLGEAAEALGAYQGTGRRFDVLGDVGGVTVVDDYAHHPSEIRATLSAARARYPGREIWAVWQPHTYSRTRALFDAFCNAFEQADHVLVTEIYAAREPVEVDFTALNVVTAMQHQDAHFVESFNQAVEYLMANLQPGDVLLVLSAGDADQIGRLVLTALKEDLRPTEEAAG